MKCPHTKLIINPAFVSRYHNEIGEPYENTKGAISYRLADGWSKISLNNFVNDQEAKGRIFMVEPFLSVPCGKCAICMSNKKQEWLFRLKQELDNSCGAMFCTLTYDDLHLPFRDKDGNYYRLSDTPPYNEEEAHQSLCKRDVQLFMKRLRKQTDALIAKYQAKHLACPVGMPRFFLVGEYGGKLHRPHYHCILFNIPHWPVGSYDPFLFIGNIWQQGQVDIAPVNGSVINYVVSYLDLKKDKPHENSEEQFALMSRRPGIGANYLDKSHIKSFYDYDRLKDNNVQVSHDGIKMPMPTYYKNKIYSDFDKIKKRVHDIVHPEPISEQDYEIEEQKRKQTLVKEKILLERAVKRKKHI